MKKRKEEQAPHSHLFLIFHLKDPVERYRKKMKKKEKTAGHHPPLLPLCHLRISVYKILRMKSLFFSLYLKEYRLFLFGKHRTQFSTHDKGNPRYYRRK